MGGRGSAQVICREKLIFHHRNPGKIIQIFGPNCLVAMEFIIPHYYFSIRNNLTQFEEIHQPTRSPTRSQFKPNYESSSDTQSESFSLPQLKLLVVPGIITINFARALIKVDRKGAATSSSGENTPLESNFRMTLGVWALLPSFPVALVPSTKVDRRI